MQELTVTQKRQTTLPKPVRAALGLQPGDRGEVPLVVWQCH